MKEKDWDIGDEGSRDKKRKGRERKFENKNECSQIELKQHPRRVMIMKSNKKVPVSVNEITLTES